MMYVQLAWRNIWRNTRRTVVILLAVIIGIWSMILLGALMRGIAVGMIKNGISTLTGHIQIHRTGYRDDPSIEHSINTPQAVERVLQKLLPSSVRWTSRVRVNAVASNARLVTSAMQSKTVFLSERLCWINLKQKSGVNW
jgi:ABC-type lipoprotein release transport system permease subunit